MKASKTTSAARSRKVANAKPRKAAKGTETPRAETKGMRRTAILVLGMHRSGTSALARVLNLLGCDLPKTLMEANPANEAGHWESMAVYRLNDRILESAGSTWNDWLEFNHQWLKSPKGEEFREEAVEVLNEEFGVSRLFVLKDPRNCRLLPFWLDVLDRCGARPLVLLPLRNPLEVAASLEKRDGFEPALGQLLWLRHVLDAEADSRDLPRLFSTYDQLMQSWGRLAENAQAALGVNWPRLSERSAGEIDAFLSDRYRHHRSAPENLVANPNLSSWLRKTYSILEGWARSGEKVTERSELDRIRKEFNAAAPAFARLIATGQAAREKVATLEKSLSEESGKLTAARSSAAEAEKNATQLLQELETARARAAEGERKAAEAQSQLTRLEPTLQVAESAREEIQAKFAAAVSSADQQREKAAALETELEEARARAAKGERKAAEAQAQLAQRTSALQAVEIARTEAAVKADATLAAEQGRAIALQAELDAAAARLEEAARQEMTARAEHRRLADEIKQRSSADEAAISQLREELARREHEMRALEQACADTEWRRGELEALHAEQKERATRLDEELASVKASLVEEQRGAALLKAEAAELTNASEEARRAADDLKHRLAVTESALLQRQHETEQTAVELRAARLELEQAAARRQEGEKIVAGLREHSLLLLADVKERQVAFTALESAHTEQMRRIDKLGSDLSVAKAQADAQQGKTDSEIKALKAEAEKLRAEKEALERQAREEHMRLERRLAERSDEIAALTRMVSEAESNAKAAIEARIGELIKDISAAKTAAEAQRGKADTEMKTLKAQAEKLRAEKESVERQAREGKVRLEERLAERFNEVAALTSMVLEVEQKAVRKDEALAAEINSTIAALLYSSSWRFVPGRLRLRRQMALLKRSGLFDAEWYRNHYADVAEAGVDPLRHFVTQGVQEGRDPNRNVAELKESAVSRGRQ